MHVSSLAKLLSCRPAAKELTLQDYDGMQLETLGATSSHDVVSLTKGSHMGLCKMLKMHFPKKYFYNFPSEAR